MSDLAGASRSTGTQRALALLNYLYFLAMMLVIAAILTAAMVMQYACGELPCPLCLLERAALFGICFGLMQNFRNGFSYQNAGFSLIFAILLLVVAVRQTLLDIYPRPGHEYIGSAVFGLHMPVWSAIVALCVLTAYAIKLAVIGGDRHLRDYKASAFPAVAAIANMAGLYIIAICAINFVSVIVQCGLGECHTSGYRLLQ
jgi:disulfide bond formation protein DsbB